MRQCGMTTPAVSKRGTLTLPPALRRKMDLDKLRNPMILVEEREGGLFLHPAATVPIRDIPQAQIQAWIARDEADLKKFQATGTTKKKRGSSSIRAPCSPRQGRRKVPLASSWSRRRRAAGNSSALTTALRRRAIIY